MKYVPWLVVLLVAGLWVKGYGDKRASDAVAKVRADSLATALDSIRHVSQRLAAADSALEAHEAADRQRALVTRRAFTLATARADSTAAVLDSVLTSLPDTAPLHIAITHERDAGRACRDALGACESLNLTLTERLANRDSVVNLLEPALERTRAMWQEAEKRSRPGLFGRLRIALPFMAGTALGVLVVK